MKKRLEFDYEPRPEIRARLDNLLDRAFVHLNIQESDTDEQVNAVFMAALKKAEWSPLTVEAALIAWLAVTNQMHPSYRLEYSETAMLIGVLAEIVGDWKPMKFPSSLFGGMPS